jgi:hypothetical protein
METSDFAIQPCQSKFSIWKVKANKNFAEFIRFFQISLDSQKNWPKFKSSLASKNFSSNSVSNLNLFLIFHSIILQSLVNFGALECGFHNIQIRVRLKNRKNIQFNDLGPARWSSGPGRLQTNRVMHEFDPGQGSGAASRSHQTIKPSDGCHRRAGPGPLPLSLSFDYKEENAG